MVFFLKTLLKKCYWFIQFRNNGSIVGWTFLNRFNFPLYCVTLVWIYIESIDTNFPLLNVRIRKFFVFFKMTKKFYSGLSKDLFSILNNADDFMLLFKLVKTKIQKNFVHIPLFYGHALHISKVLFRLIGPQKRMIWSCLINPTLLQSFLTWF